MSQSADIPGQGLAEFPDSMSPDEIKGVIQQKFFTKSPETTGVDAAATNKLQSGYKIDPLVEADMASTFAQDHPTIEKFVGRPAESLGKTAVSFVKGAPSMVKFLAPPKLSDVLSGAADVYGQMRTVQNAPAFSQQWWDSFVPLAVQEGMGIAGVKGGEIPRAIEKPPVQTLSERLAPLTGAPTSGLPAPEVSQAPMESVSPALPEALTKGTENAPSIQTPQTIPTTTGEVEMQGTKIRAPEGREVPQPMIDGQHVVSTAIRDPQGNLLTGNRWNEPHDGIAALHEVETGDFVEPPEGDVWYQGVGPEGKTTWVTSDIEKAKIYAKRRGNGRINVFSPDQIGESAFADQDGNLMSPQEYAKTQSKDTTIQALVQRELPSPKQVLDSDGKSLSKGFLVQDENGNQTFATREEAAPIARDAGQVAKESQDVTSLRSEDLRRIATVKFTDEAQVASAESTGVKTTTPQAEVTTQGPETTGIANRVLTEEAKAGKIGEVEPGEGMSWQEMVDLGREQLNKGADPAEIARRFQRNGRISPTDFAVLRAERERLAVESNKAAQAVKDNPNDPAPKQALDEARKAETYWIRDVVQPAKTATSDIFRGMQGEAPIDTTTFEGLRRAVLDVKGKEPNLVERGNLERRASKVQEAQRVEAKATEKLSQEIDRQLPKTRVPAIDELRAEMQKMAEELTPCK